MTKSDNISNLAASLVKVQARLEHVEKDGVNPHFDSKFCTLANIWDTIKPLLSENGLCVTQTHQPTENGVTLDTTLIHVSGEWISGSVFMPLAKHDPQSVGSCTSYGRRYSLAAIVGVCPEDDDAEGAQGRGAHFQKREAAITQRAETRDNASRAVAAKQAAASEFPANPLDNSDSLPEQRGEVPQDWREAVIAFGKNKGKKLGDLSASQIAWYANLSGDGWEPRPYKGKISDSDRELFAALNEYRLSQGKPVRTLPGTPAPEDHEGYQPGDEAF